MENEMTNKVVLSATDMECILLGDRIRINDKGACFYYDGDFACAVEYYRLAAAMGDTRAVSNLGYCYLYGRSIEPNLSLAIAYFQIAAKAKDVDAAYKLGDIYGSPKWGVMDKEKSVYYYTVAAETLMDSRWLDPDMVRWAKELQYYPSLCYALGRELSPGGNLCTDLECAYLFLKHAEKGYRTEIQNGAVMYENAYNGVLELLQNPQYNAFKAKEASLAEDANDMCE